MEQKKLDLMRPHKRNKLDYMLGKISYFSMTAHPMECQIMVNEIRELLKDLDPGLE